MSKLTLCIMLLAVACTPMPTIDPTPTLTPIPPAAIYYVDATGGSDTNTGLSETRAWRTLAKVSTEFLSETFGPGDSILFKRGETWTLSVTSDQLRIEGSSGAAGNHIYLGAYGMGADPIIDANGNSFQCIRHESWDATANYITIEDIEVTGTHDTPAIRISSVHHWTLRSLYVHDVTRDPANHTAGIRIKNNCEWIRIERCVVDEIEGEGIYIGTSDADSDTNQVMVSRCSVTNCDYEGIDIKGATQNIVVHDCTIKDTGRHASDPTQISVGGQHNTIHQCKIHGAAGKQAIYLGRYIEDIAGSGMHCRVEQCLIEGATGTHGGILIDGTGNEVIGNTFAGCSYAIYGASDVGGGHVIENNVFYNYSNEAVYVYHVSRYAFDYNEYRDGAVGVWYQGGASRDFAYVQDVLRQEEHGFVSE